MPSCSAGAIWGWMCCLRKWPWCKSMSFSNATFWASLPLSQGLCILWFPCLDLQGTPLIALLHKGAMLNASCVGMIDKCQCNLLDKPVMYLRVVETMLSSPRPTRYIFLFAFYDWCDWKFDLSNCIILFKPVTVTRLVDSMLSSPRPTRYIFLFAFYGLSLSITWAQMSSLLISAEVLVSAAAYLQI